jgi:hypothetical protein
MTREEKENFLMKGDKFRESRNILYGFMLENMDDEHRILSRNNLVMKVLGKNEHNLDISDTQYQFLKQHIVTSLSSIFICSILWQPELCVFLSFLTRIILLFGADKIY